MEDRRWWAFWNASLAVNAFLRMNKQHRFTLVKTFYRANRYTIGVFAVKTGFCHHMCHRKLTFPENPAMKIYKGRTQVASQPRLS
jgi:hypothetical protein